MDIFFIAIIACMVLEGKHELHSGKHGPQIYVCAERFPCNAQLCTSSVVYG